MQISIPEFVTALLEPIDNNRKIFNIISDVTKSEKKIQMTFNMYRRDPKLTTSETEEKRHDTSGWYID